MATKKRQDEPASPMRDLKRLTITVTSWDHGGASVRVYWEDHDFVGSRPQDTTVWARQYVDVVRTYPESLEALKHALPAMLDHQRHARARDAAKLGKVDSLPESDQVTALDTT